MGIMPTIKTKIMLASTVFLMISCVERYYLDEHIESITKLVVEGYISNKSETQHIVLSRSSSPDNPEFTPYSGCTVHVVDEGDRTFDFQEATDEPGNYYGQIEEQYLFEGAKFQLFISTPDNKHYRSTQEEILPAPPIDTVYYEITTIPTSDPEISIDGVQFYLDFLASDEYGQKFRFVLEESYEYHSTWPKRAYLDETGFHYPPADYSTFICYQTQEMNQIFLLSTSNLTENTYIKYPLHFVDDHTQRLLYNYSILIKQYTLSEPAYEYWEILKENNQDIEGLFNKQPSALKSNVFQDENPEELVLGYFGVSSVVDHRIVMGPVKELSFRKVPYCAPSIPEVGYPPDPRPLYLVLVNGIVWGYAYTECFDCTLLGGSLIKPPFFE